MIDRSSPQTDLVSSITKMVLISSPRSQCHYIAEIKRVNEDFQNYSSHRNVWPLQLTRAHVYN